jgi:putative ABC transport system permease protein
MPPIRELNANDTEFENFVPRPGGPIQNVDYYQEAGDRFFETLGIRLQEGRFFDARDGDGAPAVVIVNRTLAERFWPGQSALGRRLCVSGDPTWRSVAGVVGDVKNAGVDKPAGTELFFPLRQTGEFGFRTGYVAVRSRTSNPRSLTGPVRRAIQELDSSLPIAEVREMEDIVASANSRPRFLTLLLTIFSTIALVLAAVGIYGVIAYSVAQRTNEFGVRMAIGAQRGDVMRMVLGQGPKLAVAGVAGGLAGAFVLTRFMRGMLFGTDSLDAFTFAMMACMLAGVATLASFLPALRATRVEPVTALRYE